jgi:hypothetical protein
MIFLRIRSSRILFGLMAGLTMGACTGPDETVPEQLQPPIAEPMMEGPKLVSCVDRQQQVIAQMAPSLQRGNLREAIREVMAQPDSTVGSIPYCSND